MEIFVDTANLSEIEEFKRWGILKGVTTNQKIFSKEKGVNFEEHAKKILSLVFPYPVSLEGPNDLNGILEVAEQYHEWGMHGGVSNTVIKVPMLGNGDGLKAVKILEESGIKTNVTACMTSNQAFLAACAGASYVSLFYNRMRDWWYEKKFAPSHPLQTVKDTVAMLSDFKTKLIIGSIRSDNDIIELIPLKPDIITITPKILRLMPFNEKTEATLLEFEKAWEEFKKAEKK